MKKKIGIIIAILLCVVLLLTFVSCKKKDTTTTGLTDVDASVIAEKDAKIKADIERWLTDNASDKSVDLSTKLKAKLSDSSAYYLMTSKKEALKPTISVTYDKGTETYKVIFTWKNKSGEGTPLTKTYTAKAVKVEYDGWAGSFKDGTYDDIELDDILNSDDKADVLNDILDAAFNMVNKTVTDSVSGAFGVEGLIGVEFGDKNYGLDVKGNIDLHAISNEEDADPNNTEFAIVAKNGDTQKAFGGLYYEHGATAEASKIYVSYLENGVMKYKYIDQAILNELFDKIGLQFREGKDDVISSEKGNTGLALLFELFGQKASLADTVANIAGGLIDAYQTETDSKEKISVIDINCANLITTLSTYASVLNAPMKEILKDVDYLKYLDLTEMHGIVGHITIIVKADAAGRLTDFELAINIPKCTFYPCADETKSVDVPAISLALYVKDFALSADKHIANVIPAAASEAEYFSPANFNIQGDVHVYDAEADLDDTFRYQLVTEINPFKPSEAKASLTIKQSQGDHFDAEDYTMFFKLTYDQKTKTLATGGTAYDMNDGGEKAYTVTFNKSAIEDIKAWLGIVNDDWHGFSYNTDYGADYGYIYIADWTRLLPSAKAFFDNELGRYLLEYYKSRKIAGAPELTNGDSSAAETGLGGGSSQTDSAKKPDLITQIKGYATDVVGIINKIKDSNVKIKDKSFAFNMTAEQINGLVADINKVIKNDLIALANKYIPGAKIPETITDPSVIDLQVNTDAHKKQLYLSFTYADDVYEITFDTFVEDQFAVYYKLVKADKHVSDDGTKTFTFDLVMTKDTITATYKKDGVIETKVTHSNFSIDWGSRNYEAKENGINNLEMYTEEELLEAEKIFKADGTGIGTNLVGGLMKFLNSDVVFPVAKILGRVGARNLAKVI